MGAALEENANYFTLADAARNIPANIEFDLENIPAELSCIFRAKNGSYFLRPFSVSENMVKAARIAAFFHELLHYFNFLRAPLRLQAEYVGYGLSMKESECVYPLGISGNYYWRDLEGDEEREKVSAFPWAVPLERKDLVHHSLLQKRAVKESLKKFE